VDEVVEYGNLNGTVGFVVFGIAAKQLIKLVDFLGRYEAEFGEEARLLGGGLGREIGLGHGCTSHLEFGSRMSWNERWNKDRDPVSVWQARGCRRGVTGCGRGCKLLRGYGENKVGDSVTALVGGSRCGGCTMAAWNRLHGTGCMEPFDYFALCEVVWSMRVISRKAFRQAAKRHPDAEDALDAWYRITKPAKWTSIQDVRGIYPHADAVGDCAVFNLKGNRYRLVVRFRFHIKRVYIVHVLTHAEYKQRELEK
jgi:mRNA interferase HigB